MPFNGPLVIKDTANVAFQEGKDAFLKKSELRVIVLLGNITGDSFPNLNRGKYQAEKEIGLDLQAWHRVQKQVLGISIMLCS